MKKVFISLLAVIGVVGILQTTAPLPASAQFDSAKEEACKGLGVDNSDKFIDCNDSQAGGSTISNVLKIALNILSFVAGITAVILIIIGGLKFINSQGDSQSASSARNTIIYAVVGLIIVAMSQIIVNYVIDKSTSSSTTTPTSANPINPATGEPR